MLGESWLTQSPVTASLESPMEIPFHVEHGGHQSQQSQGREQEIF